MCTTVVSGPGMNEWKIKWSRDEVPQKVFIGTIIEVEVSRN